MVSNKMSISIIPLLDFHLKPISPLTSSRGRFRFGDGDPSSILFSFPGLIPISCTILLDSLWTGEGTGVAEADAVTGDAAAEDLPDCPRLIFILISPRGLSETSATVHCPPEPLLAAASGLLTSTMASEPLSSAMVSFTLFGVRSSFLFAPLLRRLFLLLAGVVGGSGGGGFGGSDGGGGFGVCDLSSFLKSACGSCKSHME